MTCKISKNCSRNAYLIERVLVRESLLFEPITRPNYQSLAKFLIIYLCNV